MELRGPYGTQHDRLVLLETEGGLICSTEGGLLHGIVAARFHSVKEPLAGKGFCILKGDGEGLDHRYQTAD